MSLSSGMAGNTSVSEFGPNGEPFYKLENVEYQIMQDVKTHNENEDFKSDYEVNVQDIKNDITDTKAFETSDYTFDTLDSKINLDHSNNMLENKIMQETIFSNNNIKKECVDYFCCENCHVEYEMYCSKCSMLSHILDDTISFQTHKSAKETIPKNILHIDYSVNNPGIYALRTIPKNVIFGPFVGLKSSLNDSEEAVWKVKDKKLLLKEEKLSFSNWMQFVNCATQIVQQNLDIFQYKNRLYYRSIREIRNGEELLIYLGDDHVNYLENSEVTYLNPTIEKVMQNVYACTYCCLGFRSNTHLLSHKNRCHNGMDMIFSLEDMVQCEYCNMYMVKAEYSEYHVDHCSVKYTRSETPDSSRNNLKTTVEELEQRENIFDESCDITNKQHETSNNYSDVQHFAKKYGCDKCSYRTYTKYYLIQHSVVHREERPFTCNMCNGRFKRKKTLTQHITNIHVRTKNETPNRIDVPNYLHAHEDVKSFVCKLCGKGFATKQVFEIHMTEVHPNINEGGCEASEDDSKNVSVKFAKTGTETDDESSNGSGKPIERTEEPQQFEHTTPKLCCSICKTVFSAKIYLTRHIKFQHMNSEIFCCYKCDYKTRYKGNLRKHLKTVHNAVKNWQCSHCPYKTTVEVNLKRHMDTHNIIKPFKCDKCGKEFRRNYTLTQHVREKHSETDEKKYKCSDCEYQTNSKSCFGYHLNKHKEVKPFRCEICSVGFTMKGTLVKHMKSKHSSDEEKYKCPRCSYRTSLRYALKSHHMCVHEGMKPFFCEICNTKFSRKYNLAYHNKMVHKMKGHKVDE